MVTGAGCCRHAPRARQPNHHNPLDPQPPPHTNRRVGSQGKPGLVAVPGALLSSQQISSCPLGLPQNPDTSCGTPGSANHTTRKPTDVVGHGMGLLISKDGVHWSLFKKLWPFGGMYTTMAALTTDKEGAALTYAVIFAAGSLGKLLASGLHSPKSVCNNIVADRRCERNGHDHL